MPIFRATVWHASSASLAVEDYNPDRYIAEMEAENEEYFECEIRDRYIHDVDADIVIGPISKKIRETKK